MSDAVKTAIGLMSGTSMDGIDVALIRTDGEGFVEVGPSASFDYSAKQRQLLEAGLKSAQKIENREDRPDNLGKLEIEITDWHCDSVENFLAGSGISAKDVDLVGFHGQTVLHRPEQALTVQLGLGQRMAGRLGIDVAYDFRANDMTNAGQGAPLVPIYHKALSMGMELPVVFVNIGGISNVTFVGENETLLAFDSGPGNALIDQWVLNEAGIPFDQGGRIGSEGSIVQSVVERYLAAPYFKSDVPKSLDRFDFPALGPAEMDLADGARSLAHVSAAAVFKAGEHFPTPPKLWVISGGGRLNATMMNELRILVEDAKQSLVLADELGLNGDMLEAEAFGYLAVRSQLGLPLTFPGTTGCQAPVSGGIIVKTI